MFFSETYRSAEQTPNGSVLFSSVDKKKRPKKKTLVSEVREGEKIASVISSPDVSTAESVEHEVIDRGLSSPLR